MAVSLSWLEPLQRAAFTLWGAPVSWAELLGDATGIGCVWLLARQKIWTWPIGILNNVFFFMLFMAAKLYGDAVLQIVFAVLGAYGWWTWGRTRKARLVVRRTTVREWSGMAAATVVGTAMATLYLSHHTDSPVPFWDGLVLVLSLVATYGQTVKLLESWWIWIAVDVVSVPLYANRGLYPTALLYFAFGCLCVVGLRSWQQTYRAQGEAVAA